MASSYTSGEKIIAFYSKQKKITTINPLPKSDFDAFVNWLESEIKKEEELQIDPVQKKIVQQETTFNSTLLNKNKSLKTYNVGKNYISIFIIFSFSIILFTTPIILAQKAGIADNVLMYAQTIGAAILIIGFLIYSMFIQNKLTITNDSMILKGLFLNRKLKFSDIKGFKIAHETTYKGYRYIVIVSNINTKKTLK